MFHEKPKNFGFAAELGDLLERLYPMLQRAGAFDAEAGDQIHSLYMHIGRRLNSLADDLDLAFVPASNPSRKTGGGGTVVNSRPRAPKGH